MDTIVVPLSFEVKSHTFQTYITRGQRHNSSKYNIFLSTLLLLPNSTYIYNTKPNKLNTFKTKVYT